MGVVIPALDEEHAIGDVLAELRRLGFRRTVVVDGGSRDGTRRVAAAFGAEVVIESRRGYGRACQAGIAELARSGAPEAVAFLDADGASRPTDLSRLVSALAHGYDFVLGSRPLGNAEERSVAPIARIGNRLSCRLIRALTGFRYTDSGPLRVLRWQAIRSLALSDQSWGWNVEMQLKAARAGLRILELPVSYRRRRTGRSKISGDPWLAARAGAKILYAVARHAFWRPGIHPREGGRHAR